MEKLMGVMNVNFGDGDESYRMEYLLTEEKNDMNEMAYGVKISKVELYTRDLLESSCTKPLFTKRDRAEKFANLLFRNDVFPITLEELIEDEVIKEFIVD